MSINMDGGNETDYSDFEYQQAVVTAVMDPDGSGAPNLSYLQELNPLADIGGLDNNEVAELVHLEVQPTLEPDGGGSDTDFASHIEHRGLVGANIGDGNGLNSVSTKIEGEVTRTKALATDGDVFTQSAAEDRVFQLYSTSGTYPYDGSSSPAGGGNINDGPVYVKPFRNLVGRGPVLDSSDDLSVSGTLIGQGIADQLQGTVRLSMVWDTAETSDAGRAFSVPMDD